MEKSPYSKCSRCGGNMIHESFLGPTERFTGFRCLICGEVIDPIILQNRWLMKAGNVMMIPDERAAVRCDLSKMMRQ